MRLIRSSFLLIFLILFFSNAIYSQQYSWPESAVYDAVNDRYLISNTGSGDIIAVPRSDPSNMSTFVLGTASGWVSMRGLTIIGNTIWGACSFNDPPTFTQALVGFDLDGTITSTIEIPGIVFINDVTADASGIIYLSNQNNILRVDPATGTFTTLLNSPNAFNGLYYDIDNDLLLYTDDSPTNGAQISVMDMSDNSTSVLFASPAGIQFCDGLTMDHLGNIYYSVWSTPNQVMRYNSNTGIVDVASTGHNGVLHDGAADIFYHDTRGLGKINNTMSSTGTLVVPNFGTGTNFGTVDFIPFEQLETDDTEVSVPSEFRLHQNFPNPFNPTTIINYDINEESLVNITVYNLLGSEVVRLINNVEQPGLKSVTWDGRNSKGKLVKAGAYIYKLNVGKNSQTKKMVLLK